MARFKRSRLNNMSPTRKIPQVTLSSEEIEQKINEKMDEGISKLQSAKNYMIMLKDNESAEKLADIILELDNFGE